MCKHCYNLEYYPLPQRRSFSRPLKHISRRKATAATRINVNRFWNEMEEFNERRTEEYLDLDTYTCDLEVQEVFVAASSKLPLLPPSRAAIGDGLSRPARRHRLRQLPPELPGLDSSQLPSHASAARVPRLSLRSETRHANAPNSAGSGRLRLVPHSQRLGRNRPGGAPHPASGVVQDLSPKHPATANDFPHPGLRLRVPQLSPELSGLETSRLPPRASTGHVQRVPQRSTTRDADTSIGCWARGLRPLPRRGRLDRHRPGRAPRTTSCLLPDLPSKRGSAAHDLPRSDLRARMRQLSPRLSGLDSGRLPPRAGTEQLPGLSLRSETEHGHAPNRRRPRRLRLMPPRHQLDRGRPRHTPHAASGILPNLSPERTEAADDLPDSGGAA